MKRQLKRGQFTLTPLQVQRLIDKAPTPRDRLIVMLMAGAGLRRSEVLNLTVGCIHDDPALHVFGKGNKARYVPIKPNLYQELKFYIGKRRGLVFPSKFNPTKTLTPCVLNAAIANTGRRAKIENPNPEMDNINCHLLRHTYARGLKDAGMSMEAIQNIMGHSSIKTTMDVYGLMSKDDIKKQFQKRML